MNMSRNDPRSAQTVIFLGISGSGKDTQAEFLLRAWGRRGKRISTGDGLRRMMRRKNLAGRYVKRVLDRGGLVPAWGPVYVWLSAFIERLEGDEHLVFTGAPRRIGEAILLDGFMRDIGRPLPRAIYLNISDGVVVERLLARGRHDDNPRAIKGRINFFKVHVSEVIRYYRRRRRLVEINGDRDVPAVCRDIKRALNAR